MAVAFTGNSVDFRRHTRRDAALNLVLGGLYTPVARRRAAQYLHAHTSIDGSPLDHVPVRKSPWPAVLLVTLFLALRIANEFGRGPPLPVTVVAGVLLLPWLWGTTTSRSIGALRWRDWPVAFEAGWREIYAASWPVLLLGAAWAAAAPTIVQAAARPGALDARWLAGAAAAAVVALPLLVRWSFNLQRLKFKRTRVGAQALQSNARFLPFLRQWLAFVAALFATAVLPVLALRFAIFGSLALDSLDGPQEIIVPVVAIALAWLLSTPARAWHEAKLFALQWNGLRLGDAAVVTTTLDARAFARLRCRALADPRQSGTVAGWAAKVASLRIEATTPGTP